MPSWVQAAALPRLDGATALYPVYSAIAEAVYPPPASPEGADGIVYGAWWDEKSFVRCGGTIKAYDNLLDGGADIIFCAAPSASQRDKAAALGMEFFCTPIGREAFVFFVNRKNPVSNLSTADIRAVYLGKIKNWKKLGGKNMPIRAFQRPENSGSQTVFNSIMEGVPVIEIRMEDVPADMFGMIRRVAGYRNFPNALGYSFLFYTAVMDLNKDIKILSLDGITPSRETIRDGSYPFSDVFYAVTLYPVQDSEALPARIKNVKALVEWICSDEGQSLIEKCGYTRL